MSKQQPPANSNLEQILADLEQKFGASSSEEKPTQKSYKKKTVAKLSKQTLLSLVALVVIVVGAAASYFLVPQSQEIRQRASVAYPNCGAGSIATCVDQPAGGPCLVNGQLGSCQNSETSDVCSCIPSENQCKNQGQSCNFNGDCCGSLICNSETKTCQSCTGENQCLPSGGSCCTGLANFEANPGACGASNRICRPECSQPGECTAPGLLCCDGKTPVFVGDQVCPVTESACPAPQTPTRTPTPRPTNTPVIVQPTNTPGSGGTTPVPTEPPANTPHPSNTPTRTPTPVPTNTPVPTGSVNPTVSPTPPAPVCLSLSLDNVSRPQQDPQLNDYVTFTCGEVVGIPRYEFRVQLPDGSYQTVSPTANGSRVSQPFQFTLSGRYAAQCRICSGATTDTCQEWE